MRIFERYFHMGTSLDQIDKYVRLVLKTFDPEDDIEVTYEDQSEAQFVRIVTVSYTHLRAHETVLDLVCRLLLVYFILRNQLRKKA